MLSTNLVSPIIIAYLIGSINSAILICKAMGLPNPKTIGSGNPGTTNVLRTGNKKAAALTLLFDILKGVIAVVIGRWLEPSNLGASLVAFAAVTGHIFPIYHHFKGGKGVATALGTLLALSPPLGLMVMVTWVLVAVSLRYSSLAAIVATLLMPVYSYWFIGGYALIPLIAMALLVLYKHWPNMVRLVKKQESKIQFSKRDNPSKT